MKRPGIRVLVILLLLVLFQSTAATTIEVIYLDDPGEGAFDETPVPVNLLLNNSGTTLGEQSSPWFPATALSSILLLR